MILQVLALKSCRALGVLLLTRFGPWPQASVDAWDRLVYPGKYRESLKGGFRAPLKGFGVHRRGRFRVDMNHRDYMAVSMNLGSFEREF